MKIFCQSHKKALLLALAALLAAWCLWYARPVDAAFLLGQETPTKIEAILIPQWAADEGLPPLEVLLQGDDVLPLWEELGALRFRRSPLEPLLRVLPPQDRGPMSFDPKLDCRILLYIQKGSQFSLTLDFWIDEWAYGPYGNLPLYVKDGQGSGRKLADFLGEQYFTNQY